MPEQEQAHAKVTIQMLYDKQLENNKLLIEAITDLKSLKDIPDRVRLTEIAIAKFAWIEKVAYAALSAGVVSIVSAVVMMSKG